MSDPDVIGVRAAAAILRVHENTVRNWVRDGRLTDVRPTGTRQLRLSRAEVQALASGLPLPLSADVEQAAREGYRQGVRDVRKLLRQLDRGLIELLTGEPPAVQSESSTLPG